MKLKNILKRVFKSKEERVSYQEHLSRGRIRRSPGFFVHKREPHD